MDTKRLLAAAAIFAAGAAVGQIPMSQAYAEVRTFRTAAQVASGDARCGAFDEIAKSFANVDGRLPQRITVTHLDDKAVCYQVDVSTEVAGEWKQK